MTDQNTERQSDSTSPDPSGDDSLDTPREDDRNVALDQSPVPDPEAKPTGASDDPQAD